MNRKDFVKHSVVTAAGISVVPSLLSFSKGNLDTNKLVILHTNDTHSNIDTFDANHAKYPNRGGVSRRFEIIQKIRSEEENVLLLDAGDIFQGTPYFNKFGGVLEMKLMQEMKYDAATMGNHDFDGGMDGFKKAKAHVDFPFLCSNYNFSDTILNGETKEYQVFSKGKFKVGVFGVGVELDGLVSKELYKDTQYNDPIKAANRVAGILKNENNCDVVICLSHLGYSYESKKVSDRVLAASTSNIDLIIGGHTHTFLDKPVEIENLNGEIVLVNQVGWAGLSLGRIDFYKEKKSAKKRSAIKIQNN